MFEYTIANVPDEEIFKKQCTALEKHIPGIVKGDLLHDVDDSKVQKYTHGNHDITVHNSHYIGAVYIKSSEDLTVYFNQ